MFRTLRLEDHDAIRGLLTLLLLAVGTACAGGPSPRPEPRPLSPAERAEELLSRMTAEEKFWQLFMVPSDISEDPSRYRHGVFGLQVATRAASDGAAAQGLSYASTDTAKQTAERINALQRHFAENTRLGIPILPFDEALHGLVRPGATAFPQAIGLAATWDPELVHEIAAAIARECHSRGIRQVLSPVVNLARDVRWGRVEETYGEDPVLAARMGVSFVSAFERAGIVATPKHFAVNVGAGGRDSYPVHPSRRLLEEVYLPPFCAALRDGGARSLMTAYNSLDGVPCTANEWLLRDLLKGEWDFRGFVISDAGAVGGINDLHAMTPDYAASGAAAVRAGLDVLFQTSFDHHALFIEPFLSGDVPREVVDDAVRRVLRVKFELGLFDDPYVDPAEAERWNGHPRHRELAREAALRSCVLLRNEGGVLPFSRDLRSLAVIGPDAKEGRLGGYSGPGTGTISILDGLKQEAGPEVVVTYAPGCGRESPDVVPVPGDVLQSDRGVGLRGEYFENLTLAGEPVVVRTEPEVRFRWTLSSPDPELPRDWYSARWTGRLVAPVSGEVRLGLEGNDGYRLWWDGELLIDHWKKQSYGRRLATVSLEKGKACDLRIEYFENTGDARLTLVWSVGADTGWRDRIDEAAALAAKSDAAVVVVGIEEGEFQDRASLRLPGHQEKLIHAVADTGTPVVVLLVGGSAVTMSGWVDRAPGLMAVWYPGEAGGAAIADLLFGNASPSGKLPITFPMAEGQLPLFSRHEPTGRGDDYRDLTGQARFPFGFGLSYTTFAYSDLRIDESRFASEGRILVDLGVENTGERAGAEVVQLYLRDEISSVARPVRELVDFRRVSLDAGESSRVTFELTRRRLTLLDRDLNRVLEPGTFRVMVGSSSRDLRLRGTFEIGGSPGR